MKNLFKSLLSFVAVAASFVACNPEQPIDVPAGTVISVDLTQEQLANLPAKDVPAVTFNVTSDGEWLATSPAWITIDPSHAKGNASVTITVADNVDADGKLQGPRTGKVTLSLVDAEVSVEILVQQLGDESLDTRRTYVKVTQITSGKAYLLVVKKTDGKYVIPILFGPTGTYGYPKPKEVTLESDGSIAMEDASYGLIFTDAGRDAAYKIQQPDGRYIWHQSGFNTWSCAENPTEGNLWKLDHVYEDGTVRICDTDAAGILQYGNGGYDSFAAYASTDDKSILPFLYEDTKAAEIDDSKCFFPSTSVKVAADSTKATFEVSANIPWELTKTEGDWITDFTPKSGSADATITVTFPANSADGAEAREAKFHLASTDGKKTADLTLTQGSPVVLTFAEIIPELKEDATSTGAKNALVMAAANKRYILNDGTAYMFAYYDNADKPVAVGDKVDVAGDAMIYDGCPEWNKPILSVTSSNNEVKLPEPEVLDADGLAAYEKAPEIKLIQVEAAYDGKDKKVGDHIIYTHAAGVTFEKDKSYTIVGYAIGYSSKYKNISVVVTSCEEVKIEYAQFELSEAAAEVEAAAGTKTFKVVADDNVGWTVALPADVTGARLAITGVEDGSLSAKGTKDVTITYAENKAAGPVEYKVTVTAAADAVVENKTLVYTLTQKAPEGSVALTFQWAEGTDTADTVAFTAGTYTWTVNADAAVEYEVSILSANGTVLVKGTDFTVENNVITFPYAVNKNPAYVTWRVSVTTANENAETKSLEATLVQEPYEYSDMAEVNDAIIKAGRGAELSLIVNIPEDQPLEVTRIYETTDKNGNAHKSVFLQNNTGALLLYDVTKPEGISTLYAVNKQIVGRFTVTSSWFNGLPEIKAVSCKLEDIKITYPSEPKYYCFTRTIAEIEANYPKYVNAKCLVKDVEVTKAFGNTKAGEIKDASGTLAIYNYSTDLTVDIPVGSKASKVVVWPTVYNSHQLGFYQASQFYITSIPGQIVMPKTLSVVVGEEGISLGATAPYGGTITYVSSDDTKATVSDAGVVTGVAAGTATITASVPATTVSFLGANIPVTAATATCEVTVTAEAVVLPDPVAVRYDFTTISGFDDWGTSYTAHDVDYTECVVSFESANHQGAGSTIENQPVTKGKSVALVLKPAVGTAIKSAMFACTQWGTKAQTITLHYSTDGGTTYTSTGVTSTTFSISSDSLPAGTNAVKITFSSTSNQVGIAGAAIEYYPVSE